MGEEPVQGSSPSEEKVFVSVRVRPLNEKEITRYEVPDWECISDNTIIYRNNLSVSERSMYSNAYMFDRVFGPDCSTRKVYEEGAKEVALSVASGINASVFAYGQTSSGKTYTMSGITEYAIADIYNYIEMHKEREFLLKLSAMEIYNEAVRDLLSADTTPLRLLDDPERGTIVEKLTEETLRDWSHFQELLSVCEEQRQIGETALNESSSRSHQILRLTIESSAREFLGKDGSSILTATVNFVDLAGSERASQSLSAGARLKEGCHINRSLLTLGTVIRKLSKGRSGHIPFRDSKLTRILQSSLGGNSRTSIICTMSPARCHVEQSRNTLLFASCAKEVTTNAQVNVVMSDKALVKQLQRELARLEDQIKSPRVAPVTSDTANLLREKDLQIEKLKNEIKQLSMQQEVVKSEVEDLRRLVGDPQTTMENENKDYPKLRVRRSWGSENPSPYTPICVDPKSMEIGPEASDGSLYSDAQSRTDSGEHRARIPDYEVSSSQSESDHSIHPPIRVPNLAAGNSISFDESEECSDGDNSEDFCKVVRCIETEPERSNWDLDDSTSDCVPVAEMTFHIRSDDDEEEENSKDLTTIEDDGQDKIQIESPYSKENNDLDNNQHSPHLCPWPDKTSEMPEQKEIYDVHTGQFMWSRSRSCDAMGTLLYPLKADIEENHSMPTKIYEEESTGSREICQQEVPPSKHSSPKALSLSGRDDEFEEKETPQVSTDEKRYSFENSTNDRPRFLQLKSSGGTTVSSSCGNFERRNAPSIELEVSSAQVGTDDKRHSFEVCSSDRNDGDEVFLDTEHRGSSYSVPDSSNAFSLSEDTQYTSNHKEVELSGRGSRKSVREVGLDPMQDDYYYNSPRRLPFEYKRVQREIIRLWDECNVLLVHRTYFYLLVKDDPADSVYMEVEMRRLSFLREMFSRGNQIRDNDRAVTSASSVRDLRRERQMLSKQMHKKLTSLEREALYVAWGIGLDTRNRSLQVAHKLWSNTEDEKHIGESATVVAKLVGFSPEQTTSKEMLGLNFAPRRSTSRSLSVFRRTMMMLTGNLQ